MNFTAPDRLFDLSGKVVLITGAGAGIGTGIARRFAESGADIAAHYRRSAEGAKAVADDASAAGRRALTVQAAVESASEVQAMVDRVVGELGRLDVMINNAGIYPKATLLDMTEAEWDETIDANLKGVFLCT